MKAERQSTHPEKKAPAAKVPYKTAFASDAVVASC